MRVLKLTTIAAALLLLASNSWARENVKGGVIKKDGDLSLGTAAANCAPPEAQTDLAVNNVRARVLTGGDLWWDPVGRHPHYEIPKVEPGEISRHSLFAGALWFGGVDPGGNLKVAAMTYRQSGYDFWPGPLDTTNASVDPDICAKFDKHFRIKKSDVEEYVIQFGTPGYTIPQSFRDWPGNGDQSRGQAKFLAPFVDYNNDGKYNPDDGDYPQILGDEALWWVYNDKGNIHTEFNGAPLGLEVRAMAFAFATSDELNNATFYEYTIINRGFQDLKDTWFGQWVDADLGYAFDDYVGCDVGRALGICYNGDNFDETATGYGANPPSIGVDFFQGPLADPNDGLDNDLDGLTDEPGETIGMSRFVYYNNDNTPKGNPNNAQHIYNYLRGFFKDGARMTWGGDGYNGGVGGPDTANWMFPGTTDPMHPQEWTEVTAGNTPADRRFLQSAGPFTLKPGAVNKITVGVVWARASKGGATGSFDLLREADRKAQELFDNNFQIFDGPKTPFMTIVELDKQLILNIEQYDSAELYKGSWIEEGKKIDYSFQGYKIFQLANESVSTSELDDIDKARLVFQCDIKDDVAQILNIVNDPNTNKDKFVEMVNGENIGIQHSIKITQDAFASGNDRLINHKPYHFVLVAYAYGFYDDTTRNRYRQGRLGRDGKSIRRYTAYPHKVDPQFGGTTLQAKYGDGPEITRIEGRGNGGNVLDLTEESEAYIVQNNYMPNPTYKGGRGPVNLKVIDPRFVPDVSLRFNLNLTANAGNGNWTMLDNTQNRTVNSERALVDHEQILAGYNTVGAKTFNYGMSANIKKVTGPGQNRLDPTNGFLEGTITFGNTLRPWLNALPNLPIEVNNNPSPFYWVAGDTSVDGFQVYSREVLGGTWSINRLVRAGTQWPGFETNQSRMDPVMSVDVVITSDKSKWTRCVVLEMGAEPTENEGGASRLTMRNAKGIDKSGNAVTGQDGLSWFPGYAINLETGERLNMIFGEDSYLIGQNGRDMLWNPTANITNGLAFWDGTRWHGYVLGGKHFLYVQNTRYDEANALYNVVKDGISAIERRDIARTLTWVNVPILTNGYAPDFLTKLYTQNSPPKDFSDVRVRIRVAKPYEQMVVDNSNGGHPAYETKTGGIAAQRSDLAAATTALDLINVVPNPYYGFSQYEKSKVDNRVRLTNLPDRCTISIYTIDGTLVRTLEKDNSNQTYLDWDLKNSKRVPVSAGIYLMHVNAPGVGERTLKWFGIARPIDLDTF